MHTVSQDQPCTGTGSVLTTTFAVIKAHSSVKVSILLNLPTVILSLSYSLSATAHAGSAIGGEEPRDGSVTIVGKVLANSISVVFQPSGRTGTFTCSGDMGPGFFQPGEHTVQFGGSLGCAKSQTALTISVSDKTIDLKGFKIVGASTNQIKGSVAILVAPGVTGVAITGGSTSGSSGLEYFDYCLMDGGGNDGLKVSSLRCFRARSAGIDVVSDNVELTRVLVDLVAGGTSTTTTDIPGGVGIHASGKTTIMDSISRRAKTVGIWADGALDAAGNYHPVQIGGDLSGWRKPPVLASCSRGPGTGRRTSTSRATGTTAFPRPVSLSTRSEVFLDGLEIVEFGGNAVLVNGIGATIKRCSAEGVGGDSYVVTATGAGATLSGNTATKNLRGFVVAGPDATLDTNRAEGTIGAAYVMSGDRAVMTGNSAKIAKGRVRADRQRRHLQHERRRGQRGGGYTIGGNDGLFKNNTAKSQKMGSGFLVTGTNNSFNTNIAERNSGTEWVISSGNIDLGSNRKNGKTFTFGTAGGSFE